MSHRRKAKQVESYSGIQYSPPSCLSLEYSMPEETRIEAGTKRKARDMPQQEYLNYFQQAIQKILNNLLAKANSSDQILQEMKKKLLETRAVPRNLYNTTDELTGLQIKETSRRFMDRYRALLTCFSIPYFLNSVPKSVEITLNLITKPLPF